MDFKSFFKQGLSIRQFFPWIIFVILGSFFIGVYLSEKFAVSNKKDLQPCLLSSWSEWTGCESGDCQEIGVRNRTVISGTERCTNQLMVETRPCADILNCSDFNCQYTQWTTWSTCPDLCFHNNKDCNTLPNQVRFRNILRPTLPGGLPCDWTTLIEQRPCVVQGPCAPDLDCIVGQNQTCSECPDIGCTISGAPYYTMCTRSILQSQSGNGRYCSRDSLLFSTTCFLPDCTEQCLGNDYGAFSKCSNPCGPGLFFSATENQCPTLTTGMCNNGSCSTGGFSLSTFTSCSGGSFCSATDLFSYTKCFAKGASDKNINIAQSVSGGVFLGSSSSMICSTGGANAVYTYSDVYNNCVPVTWDMIGALCLFLCDPTNSITDLSRGYVFPFDDGSLSCPIDLYLLSISNVCPLTDVPIVGRPFGLENFLGLSDNYKLVNGQTFSCPISTDCEYQSWTDAKPWSECDLACANGGGNRTRTRVIIKPETFLGIPCDPFLTVETAPCNENYLTSASEMWCPSNPTISSEFLCQLQASISGSKSMHILYSSVSAQEVFLISSGTPLTSDTLFPFLTTLPNGRIASYDEVSQYWRNGGQSCNGGWALAYHSANAVSIPVSTERTCPITVQKLPWTWNFVNRQSLYCHYSNSNGQLLSLTNLSQCPENYVALGNSCSRTTLFSCDEGFQYDQGACRLLDSFNAPITSYSVLTSVQQTCSTLSRSLYAMGNTSEYVWIYGDKSYYYSASVPTEPFFTPTQPSLFDPTYMFAVESFSTVSCALFNHRTDLVVCTSLSAQDTYTHSNLVDVPCDTAKDCSLSAWTPITQCGPCLPPNSYIATRSIISRATEGGKPCDEYLLTENFQCNGPPCPNAGAINGCVPAPFKTTSGVNPDACDSFSQSYPLLENWSDSFVYSLAAIQELNGIIFDIVLLMDDRSVMPNDLAQALNAQVLDSNGSFSRCLSGLNAGGFLTAPSYLTSNGWQISGCQPDPYVDQQLLTRQGKIAKRYWDFNAGSWLCGSACPYLIDTCDFPLPIYDSCTCGISQQTLTTNYKTVPNLICLDQNFAGIVSISCINPQVPCPDLLQCPTGCDGSPCGSLSNNGFCYYNAQDNYYECSCTNGSLQNDCSILCPLGQNGLQCSGNGACLSTGYCSCSNGYFGAVCDQRGFPLVGVFESMPFLDPYYFTMQRTNTTINVTATNPLPCEDENNPGCNGVQLQVASDGTTLVELYHPFFMFNDSNTLYNANMCIQSGAGINDNANYVPNHLMLYRPLGVTSCQQVIPDQLDPFDVLCQFTSDSPSVPDVLVGKRFYTRCFKNFNTKEQSAGDPTTNYTFSQINQYETITDSSGSVTLYPYFKVLSPTTDLAQYCLSHS